MLVHGVTSSSRTWWRVGPALAERGYRVLAVDLRGHGSSPRPTAGLSVADLATDVAETVEATAGSPVDLLVGHSLGALVALELVAARPRLARRLVVEDPPGASSIDWAAMAAGIEADNCPGRHELPTPSATTWRPPTPAGPRARQSAGSPTWSTATVRRSPPPSRPGIPFDLPALLAAAPIPVLMLLGDEALGSVLLGLDRKAAVEALGDGTTRVLPAGHNLHREALDLFMAALDAWLRPVLRAPVGRPRGGWHPNDGEITSASVGDGVDHSEVADCESSKGNCFQPA